MKNIASLRTSSSSLSARRYRQNRWVSLLLPRSRWWRIVIMFPLVTLSWSFGSLLSYSPVSAQADETATPTATFRPMFPTPTAYAADYECVGVPSGYGQVTPAPGWMVTCGRCLPTLTPQPFTTNTPVPWAQTLTAQAELTTTPTAAPTITATVQPTNTPSGACDLQTDFGAESVDSGITGSPYSSGSSSILCDYPAGAITDGHQRCEITFTGNDNVDWLGMRQDTTVKVRWRMNNGTYYWKLTVLTSEPQNSGGGLVSYLGTYTQTDNVYEGVYTGGNVATVGGWTWRNSTSGAYVGAVSTRLIFEIQECPFVGSTPTPSPTPSSYCASIPTQTEEPQTFAMPVITQGQPICQSIGGFIIPFSWFQLVGIQLDDLIVPRLHICIVPTSFGTLVLANNAIDLDLVAYIMGALLLLYLVI